jgi:hypothetical protein
VRLRVLQAYCFCFQLINMKLLNSFKWQTIELRCYFHEANYELIRLINFWGSNFGSLTFKAYLLKYNLNKKFWEELVAYFPSYDMDRIENDVSNNSSIFWSVFVAAITFLPSSCLANHRGHTYRHKNWWGGGEIYELGRWEGLRCHDVRTKLQ